MAEHLTQVTIKKVGEANSNLD